MESKRFQLFPATFGISELLSIKRIFWENSLVFFLQSGWETADLISRQLSEIRQWMQKSPEFLRKRRNIWITAIEKMAAMRYNLKIIPIPFPVGKRDCFPGRRCSRKFRKTGIMAPFHEKTIANKGDLNYMKLGIDIYRPCFISFHSSMYPDITPQSPDSHNFFLTFLHTILWFFMAGWCGNGAGLKRLSCGERV